MATITLKRGDTAREFEDWLEFSDGTKPDLTAPNVAGVKFLLKNLRTGQKFAVDAVIQGDLTNHVKCRPTEQMVATVGKFLQEWEIQYSDVGPDTCPDNDYNLVIILQDLNPPS